jgi:hypothetical protein
VCTRSTEEHVLDIPEPSAGRGQVPRAPLHGKAPPPQPLYPLVSLEQLLATQNELIRMLMENDARSGAGHPKHPCHQDMDSLYSDFLETHPLFYSEMTDPLEVDNCLCTTKSKFGLLHYTEHQKTLYAIQ